MRLERLGQADRFHAIRCLAHDLEVAGQGQQGSQLPPHLRIVIDDQDPLAGHLRHPFHVKFHRTDVVSV